MGTILDKKKKYHLLLWPKNVAFLSEFQSMKKFIFTKYNLPPFQEEIDEAARNKASFKDLFASKANINGLIVGLCLMLFQQLSGVNAVIFYAGSIFEQAGSTLSADNCSIIVGVVQVIATYGATVLVDRAGRRVLLLLSGSVMCACLIILGNQKSTLKLTTFNFCCCCLQGCISI